MSMRSSEPLPKIVHVQTLAKEDVSEQDRPDVLTVPPEIVELISRRNLSIIELSPYITEGIEEALSVSFCPCGKSLIDVDSSS